MKQFLGNSCPVSLPLYIKIDSDALADAMHLNQAAHVLVVISAIPFLWIRVCCTPVVPNIE